MKTFKNRKAFHDYEILEKLEAGIALEGCEVKSIMLGNLNLTDSYAHFSNNEIHLLGLHISLYKFTSGTYDPYRKRKLLLHKNQIFRLQSEISRKHLTLIPLNIYFNEKNKVKVELGLCVGLKKYDKRKKISEKENKKNLLNYKNIGKL